MAVESKGDEQAGNMDDKSEGRNENRSFCAGAIGRREGGIMQLRIIDVSEHNKKINWEQVRTT